MNEYFDMHTADDFIGRIVSECYTEYAKWCVENGHDVMYTPGFGKLVHDRYGLVSKQKRLGKLKTRIYVKGE